MEPISALNQKVKIDYPCSWSYRLIGVSEDTIIEAVQDILKEKDYTLEASNASKSGKYISMNLLTKVMNEQERLDIFHAFKQHKKIHYVL